MEFSDLEQAVLAWFESNANTHRLRDSLRLAVPTHRRSDGGGVFVQLSAPGATFTETDRRETHPVPGPHIRGKAFPRGAETALYVTEDGQPETLELFTTGDPWPGEVGDFILVQPNTPMQTDGPSGHR